MADVYTKLSDVIVPEVFNPYFRELSTRTNALIASGIVAPLAELNGLRGRGGDAINMPFWQSLDEDAQLIDDTENLEVRRVNSGQDVGVLNARALVYGGTDLAAALAGSDPMDAIAQGLAENWQKVWNRQLFSTLNGAMGALADESPTAYNSLDISELPGESAVIGGSSFIDAAYTLGDRQDRITAVAMHSHTAAELAKQGLIEFIRDSEGVLLYRTFMDKRVIVDDAMAPVDGVYTTYLFGDGAIGYAEGDVKVPVATDRDELKNGGEEFIVQRRHYLLHPRGIRWTPGGGIPAKATPSNTELANKANWTRVYEPKNIRIAKFTHRVAPAPSA